MMADDFDDDFNFDDVDVSNFDLGITNLIPLTQPSEVESAELRENRIGEQVQSYLEKTVPDDAIVIYPELVQGNPMRATNVVRWLLYKPGVRHPYHFTEGEMFFHCGKMFDVPELTGGAPELVMWRRNRTYRNENRPDRKGV